MAGYCGHETDAFIRWKGGLSAVGCAMRTGLRAVATTVKESPLSIANAAQGY
jgi:hypothetical protein